MRYMNPSQWVAALMLAVALARSAAHAQDADTFSISGRFNMDEVRAYQAGTVGDDLAAVFANGNEHWWSLTLYGVTYSHDYYYDDWYDYDWRGEWAYGYDEQFISRVHATSFVFEFFGPDADVLNQVVSQQLIISRLGDDVFLELRNGDYNDPLDPLSSGPYSAWGVAADGSAGVSFPAGRWYDTLLFPGDESGYLLVEPQRITSEESSIGDFRPGNSGVLVSLGNAVDIGSSEEPIVQPTIRIHNAFGWEGHKGTSNLLLTVTRSDNSRGAVTVSYRTVNGTALATKDYVATSGTLSFQPGQTSRTIAVSIKGDRQREANETFSVQLSDAVGATINHAVGTATILNDD